MQDVAVFWDYENCTPPSDASGYDIANNIRMMAHTYGSVKSLKAYLEITDQVSSARALAMRSELQTSGVSLIDCPHNGRKDVADKMIMVDMMAYAIDNPAPSVIVLISGDRDFAYPLSILRLRQYCVVLVTLSNAHPSLTSQASVRFDWHHDIVSSVFRPPPSRSASDPNSNPVESIASTPSDEDSVARTSSPSDTWHTVQEIQPEVSEHVVQPVDHGDLLHYLRPLTQPVCRLSKSLRPGRKELCKRSSQNASVPAEMETTNNRELTGSSTIQTSSSNSNNASPAFRTDTYPGHTQDKTFDVPSEIENFTGDQTAAQLPILSTTESDVNPWLASSPTTAIANDPILLPSLISTPFNMVQHAPVAQYTFADMEDDMEDGNNNSFVYPIRPLSSPHVAPSQTMLNSPTSVGRPISSEMASYIRSLKYRHPHHRILQTSSGNEHHSGPGPVSAQEVATSPISGLADPTSLPSVSVAATEHNRAFYDSESFSPTFGSHASVASSRSNESPAVGSMKKDDVSVPFHFQRQPTTSDLFLLTTEPTLGVSTFGANDLDPSVACPGLSESPCSVTTDLSIGSQAKDAASRPPGFNALVDTLNEETSKGNARFLYTWAEDAIYKRGFRYASNGINSFAKLVAMAEKYGIVELGMHGTDAWIALKAEYRIADWSSSTSTTSPCASTSGVTPNVRNSPLQPSAIIPPIFKILVTTLKAQRANGIVRPLRSTVAVAIARDGLTYKEAGVARWGPYAALAEEQGIIELGGLQADAWVTLRPAYC